MSSTSSSRLRKRRAAVVDLRDLLGFLVGQHAVGDVVGERLRQRLVLGLGDEHLVVRPVPGRDLMAPPELARDAPRLDVLHPVVIGLLPVLRHELGAALAHRRERRKAQLLGVDVPLVGEERLDHGTRAVAVRHHVGVWLDLVDQALLFQPRDDLLARHEAVEPVHRERRGQVLGRRHVLDELGILLNARACPRCRGCSPGAACGGRRPRNR